MKNVILLLSALLCSGPAFAIEEMQETGVHQEPGAGGPTASAQEAELSPEELAYLAWAQDIWESLDRRQGEIVLPGGVATLNVPETFYYLGPEDTEKVLVEVWGNLPGAGTESLGMLFPAEWTPFDDEAWGVTVEYEEDGYVSDAEADDIDYDKLLVEMQQSTREASRERVAQGYEAIELVGWASRPFYDKQSHKLHWAKELKFEGSPANTLNYNIRVLGRKGVLVLNFIADMDQKATIDASLDTVLALAEFNSGSRYADFNPDIDKVAAYGIGTLVAGKVAAKAGLFTVMLVFLKKFGVIVAGAVAVMMRRVFRRKTA
ncbi:MAG TPA: DUF2167 domain-containing protein [Gammaproteobacteria bacterium]|nr:DUF2167 domain-containing protein [Gammaproteobacteria bacterium]